eukprot:6105117-Prymnesium_polylepis.1
MRCGIRPRTTAEMHVIMYTDSALPSPTTFAIEKLWNGSAASACYRGRLAFLDADSTEHAYPIGPNRMFRRLLHAFVAFRKFDFFFLAELDVTPVQPLWLESLTGVLPPYTPHFWVKGSSPRGGGYTRLHINGNALYNAKDRDFLRYTETALCEHPRGVNPTQRAALRRERSNYSVRRFAVAKHSAVLPFCSRVSRR